jgi:hypothetical protein
MDRFAKIASKIAADNHKDFDTKKEALDFLKDHGLMSVGWKEGGNDKVAIYWNGKLNISDADTKKKWGADKSQEEAIREVESLVDGKDAVLKKLAARRQDKTGEPIRPVEHYILVWKLSGYGTKYFKDGSIHAPEFTTDVDEAFEFSGFNLQNMAYDWTMNWNAVKFL